MSSDSSRIYIPSLDGLRAVAILGVLFRHMTVIEPSGRYEALFIRLLDLGWIGVDLFFVLSGFLITGILMDTKKEPNYFRNFYVRRALRIFPLYYFYLGLVLFLIPYIMIRINKRLDHDIMQEGWWFWLYLSNIYYSMGGDVHRGPLMVTWSLAVEEQFYLIWPTVVFLCRPRILMKICFGLIVGALFFRLSLVLAGVGVFPVYSLLPCRIDTLATGALIAILTRSQTPIARSTTIAKATLFASFITMLGIWTVGGTSEYSNKWWLTIGFTSLSIFFASLLWVVLTAKGNHFGNRFLKIRPMVFIGKISYGIYLIHTLTILFIQRYVFDPVKTSLIGESHFFSQLLFFITCFIAVLLLASFSWHFLEKNILKLKHLFPYKTETLSRPIDLINPRSGR